MKSIKIDNHKESGHRFWSISNIYRLSNDSRKNDSEKQQRPVCVSNYRKHWGISYTHR